jgi:hypothetical protein
VYAEFRGRVPKLVERRGILKCEGFSPAVNAQKPDRGMAVFSVRKPSLPPNAKCGSGVSQKTFSAILIFIFVFGKESPPPRNFVLFSDEVRCTMRFAVSSTLSTS